MVARAARGVMRALDRWPMCCDQSERQKHRWFLAVVLCLAVATPLVWGAVL